MNSITPEVRAQLAPHGTLYAAVYLGNFLLVTGCSSSGVPTGIAPDICRAIADHLEVKLDLVGYETQEEVVEAAASGRCGIVLVGSDPARAQKGAFTNAYTELEAIYLCLPIRLFKISLKLINREFVSPHSSRAPTIFGCNAI